MTASERFRRYLRGLVDPESVLRAGVSAGLKQAGNKPPEWGGGLEGYGYRYGDVFAQHVVRRTLQAGVAAVLHEEERSDGACRKALQHHVIDRDLHQPTCR